MYQDFIYLYISGKKGCCKTCFVKPGANLWNLHRLFILPSSIIIYIYILPQVGACGIPPLLIQRYAEELRQDTDTMAGVMEGLREGQLRAQGRPYVSDTHTHIHTHTGHRHYGWVEGGAATGPGQALCE